MQYNQEPDLDTYTDLSVGEILRRTREHYGQTISQVEQNLNIRASQLHALEHGHLEQIPGRVYAIGFVRSYSDYLGLDGDKMVHLFKAQSVGKRTKPDLHFPVLLHESNDPNIHIIIFSLTGLILLIAYLSIFHAPAKDISSIPPVPEAIKEKTISMLQPPPELEVAPQQQYPNMEIRATAESWVEIKNEKNEVVVRQILKKGDVFIVPEDKVFTLSTGNAGGLTVYVDGNKISTLGKSKQVRRDIALTPDDFTKDEK